MVGTLLVVLLAQPPDCTGDAAALMATARSRAAAFDLPGAVRELRRAGGLGCVEGEIGAAYLAGLQDARDAYRTGGDASSLAPVRAMETLLMRHEARSAAAAIARVVLMAAAAAAMSERDDLAVFLEHALQLERVQHAAGRPGAPLVTAHEVAGDLWLQVHRFETALRAYREAEREVGATPRVLLGQARTAARLSRTADACAAYRRLTAAWDGRGETVEISEARAFLGRSCGAP